MFTHACIDGTWTCLTWDMLWISKVGNNSHRMTYGVFFVLQNGGVQTAEIQVTPLFCIGENFVISYCISASTIIGILFKGVVAVMSSNFGQRSSVLKLTLAQLARGLPP